MFKFKHNWAVLALIMIVLAVPVFGAHNSSVYNSPVSTEEGPQGSTWVMYRGVTAATSVANTDSVGTHYTQAMWIPYYTDANCFYNAVMYNSARGTEDCDVYVEYSYDRITWFVGSAASGKIKDQLTTTMVTDTLNTLVGTSDTYYRTGLWMRLKFSFQAGNPVGTYVTWRLIFRKPATLMTFPSTVVANKK